MPQATDRSCPLEQPRSSRARQRAPVLVLAGLGAWLATAACDSTSPVDAPTAVLYNGRIITMGPGTGEASGLAIAGETIVRVGSDGAVLALAGRDTRRIDLEGRTVLPGLVDPHTHLFNDAWRLERDLAGGQALLVESGITTIGNAFVPPDFLAEMRAFEASGELRVRTSLYLIYTDNCGNMQGDWWSQHAPTRKFGERLRIGGIKLFMDGGTCGGVAVREEYAPGSGYGDLFLTATDVEAAIRAAEETGHQALIHALGDRAVESAQDGMERALGGRPNVLRHRIDHNVLAPPDLIARYAELGIQPVLFGPYMVFAAMVPDPESCGLSIENEYYGRHLNDLRAFVDGVTTPPPAWHGDDPWVGPISPFRELYLMVTRARRSEGSDFHCPPESWQLATAITVEEGLRMMTVNSAWALHRETEVGSLEPGKLADLIVVSADPRAIPPDDLWNIQVEMTVIGGVVVFCRDGAGAICWTD